jgi:hypothetical protein
MANITRSFTQGRMNKSTDIRLMQDGEYIDALNVRTNSTEGNNVGSIENSLGNLPLTTLNYTNGTQLSIDARTIGAFEDGANERIFWFVHDPSFPIGATGKLDMIVSFDTKTSFLNYHIISIDNGGGVDTTLNFNPQYLITGVDLVENLLFFTDDYNPPRKIDINASYDFPILNLDPKPEILAESILVIRKPPVTSPSIDMVNVNQDINYMEDRFLCFAYRYRYSNNEYSATSQFSTPAFFPKDFEFSVDSMLNEGMENRFNAAIINFDTGSEIVVGVDLLYKDADDPIIKVIEKFDKKEKGWGDNQQKTYVFDNSKIYTILPDSEILRLYDNVPRFAKAQTTMGNRLIYGNYVDGYDLIDRNKQPIRLGYYTKLISEDTNIKNINSSKKNTTYTIDGTALVSNGIASFDLSSLSPGTSTSLLKKGTLIEFNIEFLHSTYTGIASPMPTNRNSFNISFVFNLNRDYSSVWDLASSSDFLDRIGTSANILPVYDLANPTSCSGYTFTDIYNCSVPSISGYTKYQSGVSSAGTPIEVISSPSSNLIEMKFPAINYVADTLNPSVDYFWDYFYVYSVSCQLLNSNSKKSLHSNRDYDIAIAYMDDYSRSTTALVSDTNTQHIPCELSDKVNSINVHIPSTQKPPFWATRYKFLIKPDKQGYETIYSQFFYQEATTKNIYFLLEGENARKVEEGDRYIVKSDTGGALNDCAIATVLEKKAQSEGFIATTNGIIPPSGVYMKIRPEDFSTKIITTSAFQSSDTDTASGKGSYLETGISCGKFVGGVAQDEPIPARARVVIKFQYTRLGGGFLNNSCEERRYVFSETYISTSDYANAYDWFVGDNIASTIGNGTPTVGSGGCPIVNKFYSGIKTSALTPDYCWNKWYFLRDTFGNPLKLVITGTAKCGTLSTKNTDVTGSASIIIYKPNSSVVFETQPTDALPDLFYESSESFPITNGLHQGNIQNQTTIQSAIISTDFFNCFSFGNGVESYKHLDSISGRQFNLGNRASSVSAEEYKEADRYSDLTYSGVYNDETNVNKLNEFNLGLLNFKPLEESFGEIQILDGKQTNVLVLQEDKISYVLAGTNILSDAGGGSALTSVPEVLGQQVTKTEEYGISHNPESYVKWGLDKFFTDAKRGAVIQMRGNNESTADQLEVISEMGMRSWFRDLFINDFNTQKLGAFDPYMNEYVLSSNDILLPAEVNCLDCEDNRTFNVKSGSDYSYCVNVGSLYGFTAVKWTVPSDMTGTITINVVYNSITYTSGPVSVNGALSIPKSLTGVTQFDITVSSTGVANKLNIITECPDTSNVDITWVVITSASASGTWGTPGLSYDDGSGISPLTTTDIPFIEADNNPNVSFYDVISGPQGSPSIPTDTSEVTMFMQNTNISTFDFDVNTNRFMYLRTNEVFGNNTPDINFLLANAQVASAPIQTDEFTYSTFAMPEEGSNLYLIWDLRIKQPLFLSHSVIDAADACCGYACDQICSEYQIDSSNESIVFYNYNDCETGDEVVGTISQGEIQTICSRSIPVLSEPNEDVRITYTRCGCSS